MIAYVEEVIRLLALFQDCWLQQVSRDDNSHADALANMASAMKSGEARTIMVDYLSGPSMEPLIIEYEAMCVEMGPSWMDAIVMFLKDDKLPDDRKEVHKTRLKLARFNLTANGHLYRRSFTGPF